MRETEWVTVTEGSSRSVFGRPDAPREAERDGSSGWRHTRRISKRLTTAQAAGGCNERLNTT